MQIFLFFLSRFLFRSEKQLRTAEIRPGENAGSKSRISLYKNNFSELSMFSIMENSYSGFLSFLIHDEKTAWFFNLNK
ncbi:hypothetical protein C6Y45_12355 [Alkalicoccus saliphilus]|uniref:Uncharacterized protein n=1 Tax=Alkalicoccus saliphilus TaxID=200989 RepID=A0A2T4U455_9BACI|nr:hypothetical protein C6Y45_12355 [Alkalicoccus saliphilus]